MFSAFDLSISKKLFRGLKKYNNYGYNDINHYSKIGKKESAKFKKPNLNKYISRILDDNSLKAADIEDSWFPNIEADVFISHSHMDEELATAFAGFLIEEMGLKVFVDSLAWGNIADLLEQVNSKYSDKRHNMTGGFLYDHEKCIKASQHVIIMLMMALNKMIDSTESVFFLNTAQSINAIAGNSISETYSPWIYGELTCVNTIRRRQLCRKTILSESVSLNSSLIHQDSSPELVVSYPVDMKSLTKLEEDDVIKWMEKYREHKNSDVNSLDYLYELHSEVTEYYGF